MIYVMPVRNLVSRTDCALMLLLPWFALMGQNTPDVRSKVANLEHQAQEYVQDQKPQLAIPILQEIALLDPKNLNAQANLGVLLFFQGKYSDAISHMRTALDLQPDLSNIEALLGIAEKRTGNPAGAGKSLEHAFSKLNDKKLQVQAGLELIEINSASAQIEK